MKRVPLPGGFFAIVDDEDFALVSGRSWHVMQGVNTVYAATNMPRPGGGYSTVAMHAIINGTPPGRLTDHRDGDGLNNRRSNLRTATRSQNSSNRQKARTGGTSQFKGVHWDKQKSRWRSSIRVNGRLHHVGLFRDEAAAAAAYDAAAIQHFGEFALTNEGVSA